MGRRAGSIQRNAARIDGIAAYVETAANRRTYGEQPTTGDTT